MKTHRFRRWASAGAATAIVAQPIAAQTTGTRAGVEISNTATATFSVNGTQQSATSNAATFLVDRKVNLNVASAQNANTRVNLGQAAAVTTFTVTNTTNAVQDFILDPDQVFGLPVLGTDDFNMTNLRAFVDANGDGRYDAATDTATYIDELAPDARATVFLVGDVPDTAGINLAIVSLNAIVAAGGAPGSRGDRLVPTALNLGDAAATVDVVFADDDSDGLGPDLPRDGRGRAYAAYEIGARNVALTITKTSRVVSDGVSTLQPKALPGAVVEYCLTVANATALVPASNVVVSDIVPRDTTYVAGSISVGGLGLNGVCLTEGFAQRDDGGNTTGPYRGSYTAGTRTVSATIPTLLGLGSVAVSFRVTID